MWITLSNCDWLLVAHCRTEPAEVATEKSQLLAPHFPKFKPTTTRNFDLQPLSSLRQPPARISSGSIDNMYERILACHCGNGLQYADSGYS